MTENFDPQDYRSSLSPIWCPGCGLYAGNGALTKALANLKIPKENVALISGIGCSARMAGYLDVYTMNVLHGRAIPVATGYKLARPDLTVIAAGGDGDILSIGAGHLPHAIRRNLDMTILLCDNRVYALTKGQTSPTTPRGETLTSGALNNPVDPLLDVLAFMNTIGTGFLAQGLANKPEHLAGLIQRGIAYRGTAFISIQFNCVTYNDQQAFNDLRKNAFLLEDGKEVMLPDGRKWIHDPSNYDLATQLMKVRLVDRPFIGVIYRGSEKESCVEVAKKIIEEKR